jgi:hypothetical protein
MSYRIPKIEWGAGYSQSLAIGYPLDDYASYSTYREGSEFAQTFAGVEDAWITGTDYVLEGTIRWIPTTLTLNPSASGWDGASGVRAFLEWARQKNQIRFYPNKDINTYITSYLVEPLDGKHTLEPDGTRNIRLVIRNSTNSYDGY